MTALRVETLDTTVEAPGDRFALWVEMAGRVSAPVAFTSDHAADFQGHTRMIDLGGIGLMRVNTYIQRAGGIRDRMGKHP
ncbi:hypothetical protein [Micromonospora avicenniae]|uniref:hypothetical protein n=1 Tax=Micromonospora avicenniae TaxID=1198245 RepID=UPI003445646F